MVVQNLEVIKQMMEDAGLQWNGKKCKCVHLKRGKHFVEDVTLSDGFKLKCLETIDLYKFLGVPECVEHDTSNLSTQLIDSIRVGPTSFGLPLYRISTKLLQQTLS